MNAAPDKFLLSCRWDFFFLCGEATQPKADEHKNLKTSPHSDISEITEQLEIRDKPAKHWQRLKIFVKLFLDLLLFFSFCFRKPQDLEVAATRGETCFIALTLGVYLLQHQ